MFRTLKVHHCWLPLVSNNNQLVGDNRNLKFEVYTILRYYTHFVYLTFTVYFRGFERLEWESSFVALV